MGDIGELNFYRQVLPEYKVSKCPYCGCKRVVIKEYSPWNEPSEEYVVEHESEEEAIKKDCFTAYLAFGDPKVAVEKADERFVD